MLSRAVYLAALLAAANLAYGHEEPPAEEEDPGPWAGKVSFGYLATSGNTENANLNGNFEISYSTENWLHTFKAYAISATEDNTTTAEAYGANWKSERDLTEDNFLFGELDYRKDRFSGFPTQFSQTVGYGHRFIKPSPHSLNGEIGVGARQSEDALGVDVNDFIVRGGLFYVWEITETTEFRQDLIVEHGEENTYLESITALKANVVGNLAMVASYTIKNNSDVLPGIEETDTYTALSLEYAF